MFIFASWDNKPNSITAMYEYLILMLCITLHHRLSGLFAEKLYKGGIRFFVTDKPKKRIIPYYPGPVGYFARCLTSLDLIFYYKYFWLILVFLLIAYYIVSHTMHC